MRPPIKKRGTTLLSLAENELEERKKIEKMKEIKTLIAKKGIFICDMDDDLFEGLSQLELIRFFRGHASVVKAIKERLANK